MTTVEAIKNLGDIKKLENFFENKNTRNKLIFLFGINTGLRVSDILNLNVSDVLNKKYIELYEKKTNKFKKFPLNNKISKLIREYLSNQNNENSPLFVSKKGNRLSRYQVFRFLKKGCKECNIDIHIGTHTMRKTFGYHHYKKFNDIAILQKIFNHSSPSVTLTYIGITQDEIDFTYRNFEL